MSQDRTWKTRPSEWDDIDELQADIGKVLASFPKSHELAMARSKLGEFCYWLRRAREREREAG